MNGLIRTPLPPTASLESAKTDTQNADALIEQATALGIPWQRILRSEIASETTMRAFFVAIDGDWPLWSALAALPFGPLRSWRVRDRLEALSSEARSVGCEASARQLRSVFRHLCGKSGASASAPALARHLWFAYQRVLVLQHIARTARHTRGAFEERVAEVARRLACSSADAEWAVRREERDDRSHLIDDTMQRARDEGFEIPRATNEARAFRKLRSVARSSPHLVRWSPTNGSNGTPDERS